MTTPKTRREQAEAAAKYKTKPVIKEALQYTGENMDALRAFVPEEFRDNRIHQPLGIKTLEGIMEITEGDWIIKGVKGEFYPCKPDVFEESYELADSTPPPQEGDEAGNDYVEAVKFSAKKHNGSLINSPFREWTRDDFLAGRQSLRAEVDPHSTLTHKWENIAEKRRRENEELWKMLERAKCFVENKMTGPSHIWLSDYERMKGGAG